MNRPPTLWRIDPLRRLRPPLQIPALPLRPLGQLQRLEGHVHRRQLGHGAEPAEARVQGRHQGEGRDWAGVEDDEQDDG